ncbi:MAG: hypothetical protein GVY27_07280 [Deinococcus-Thermus bacterium]|jgi:bacterioferritin-associated ferredoxin|nr:hypothetical protein [Deinococcota bacterium]
MIVCLCNAISESRIRREIAGGARKASAVYIGCGAAPQCGKCVCEIRRMLRETHGSNDMVGGAPPLAAE